MCSLLSLPNDCLVSTLMQSSLGARELCRLEQTCKSLLSLCDESVWRTAFLQHRRRNALREPESWKQEYARRDSWSRSWRQLITCTHMPCSHLRLGGTQKLRRFAMKMMSGAPHPPSRSRGAELQRLIVSDVGSPDLVSDAIAHPEAARPCRSAAKGRRSGRRRRGWRRGDVDHSRLRVDF